LTALFWLAISVFVCVEAIRTEIGTLNYPGPGFLPFWSGVVLGTLSIVLMVKSGIGKNRGMLKKEILEKLAVTWKDTRWSRIIRLFLLFLVYTALFPKLGYLLTTFGLMAYLFEIRGGGAGSQRIGIRLASALITAVATYLVFRIWLDVPLPKGIFGF
jgi:putative tricarboxylic transport membrane protein